MNAELLFTGTGTSFGTPIIGCECEVCSSENPKNRRLRSGAAIFIANGNTILLDVPTDFRAQALRFGIKRVDAALITHHHADHVFGLDDLRIYSYYQGEVVIFIPEFSWDEMRRIFSYTFKENAVSDRTCSIRPEKITGARFRYGGVEIQPVPVVHGAMEIYGYRIGNMAYLTDVSGIPERSFEMLQDLDLLILSALRYKPHKKHFSIDQAVEAAGKIGAKRTYLTHISHRVEHNGLKDELPPGIEPAWDGLRLEFDAEHESN